MKRLVLFIVLCLSVHILHAQDFLQHTVPGRKNDAAQQQKPYVIFISADGFRYDYAEKYQASTLLDLSRKGVRASSMIPAFPSYTFPNHYTLATGLYPAHHGLINNSFYDQEKNAIYTIGDRAIVQDSSWYGGLPIWVLAEQQHMLSASYYWVGSEAAVKGVLPSYYYYYNTKNRIDDRIRTVKEWLQLPEEKRPHLIMFYLPEVDQAGHTYGPDAPQTADAVKFIDETIGKLTRALEELQLPLNYVFVSDHGMANVDDAHRLPYPVTTDDDAFIVPAGSTMLQLYARNKAAVIPTYKKLKSEAVNFDVYLPDETPAKWHFTKKDDRYDRSGDIILSAHYPWFFSKTNDHVSPGKHGYDPQMIDMRATFMAWGPAFKPNKVIGDFENIHVYPLIAHILGLQIREPVDGKMEVLIDVLKE